MLPENRLEHRWHVAADRVDISHANMALEEVKYVGCGLTPDQKLLDPAKHHYRPSSVHQFPTKTANSCKWSWQSYGLWKDPDYTDISSDFMQSKVGWGVQLTMYLFSHRQSTKGFTSQWSFQQIKKLSYTLVGGHAIIYHGLQFECCCWCNRQLVIYPRRTVIIRRYVLTWRRNYFGWFLIRDASLPK